MRRARFRAAGAGSAVLLVIACGGAPPALEPAEPVPAGSPAETSSGAAWYRDGTTASGIDFVHDPGLDGTYYMPEVVGAGAALVDLDDDGDLDLYLVNGGRHPPAEGASPRHRDSSEGTVNRLYLQGPDGRFADATTGSGLGHPGFGMGLAAGDYDNDGDTDLYVTNLGPDVLFRNEGGGRFSDVSDAAGITGDRWSTSAAWLDHDSDGHLDLYVVSYVSYTPPKACHDSTGRPDYCGPKNFPGVPDVLYRSRGDGTFEDVSRDSGIGAAAGRGLGVFPADFDRDGRIDLYVANDGMENHFWINQGGGRFRDRAMVLGAAVNVHGKAEASMGVAVGDFDRDADLDIFMTHLDRETNTLYTNMDGRWFEDRTAGAGLGSDSLPFTGFGTEFLDVDLDGDLDLLMVNGRVRRGTGAVPAPPGASAFETDYAEPNLLFANQGDGDFANRSHRAGELCRHMAVSRGLVSGDLDGDGDLDLVITAAGGAARIFFNEHPSPGAWLAVRAIDPALSRDALGALVELQAGSLRQTGIASATASYLSAREPVVHFGLGAAERFDSVQVWWPSGERESFPGGAARQVLRLLRGTGKPLDAPGRARAE